LLRGDVPLTALTRIGVCNAKAFDTRLHRRVKQRVFDLAKAKKLPWCKPVIAKSALGTTTNICVWEKLEGHGRVRIYCWLKSHDYIVILERYTNGQSKTSLLLITAFYVDYAKKREEFEQAYQLYTDNKKAPHNEALTPSTHGR
jgi:hypothetical protein